MIMMMMMMTRLLPVMSISRCLLITRKEGCYVTNRLIDEDLEVPFFGDHSTALTESLGSNLIQGISSAIWKALVPTKGCQHATVVQFACLVCPYTVSQSTQRSVSNTVRSRWLNFSVIFLSCVANAQKGERSSFPNQCYLQPKLFPLSAQVFSQNSHIFFEFSSRASTQPKAFLAKGVIFRSHIARAAAVHSMYASGSEAKMIKPVSQSSFLVTIYKTNVPLSGCAFRTRGWFKLTRNSQAQISASRCFARSLRWLKFWMLQANSGASKLSYWSCHIFLRFLRLCLRNSFNFSSALSCILLTCCIQCQWHVFPSVMFSVCKYNRVLKYYIDELHASRDMNASVFGLSNVMRSNSQITFGSSNPVWSIANIYLQA